MGEKETPDDLEAEHGQSVGNRGKVASKTDDRPPEERKADLLRSSGGNPLAQEE